jgi:hypothetical protein
MRDLRFKFKHIGRRLFNCFRGRHLWTTDEAGILFCFDCGRDYDEWITCKRLR